MYYVVKNNGILAGLDDPPYDGGGSPASGGSTPRATAMIASAAPSRSLPVYMQPTPKLTRPVEPPPSQSPSLPYIPVSSQAASSQVPKSMTPEQRREAARLAADSGISDNERNRLNYDKLDSIDKRAVDIARQQRQLVSGYEIAARAEERKLRDMYGKDLSKDDLEQLERRIGLVYIKRDMKAAEILRSNAFFTKPREDGYYHDSKLPGSDFKKATAYKRIPTNFKPAPSVFERIGKAWNKISEMAKKQMPLDSKSFNEIMESPLSTEAEKDDAARRYLLGLKLEKQWRRK